MRPVFLMTDFGTDGFYAGVMKAVLCARRPGISVYDLGHGITPGMCREAGELVSACFDYLPTDAILTVVVDPGVGTERRALRVDLKGRTAIGPDNGCLTPILRQREARVSAIEAAHYGLNDAAPTFHGRDIFAPVAAILAGEDLAPGPAIEDPICIAPWDARFDPERGEWVGSVVSIDAFGNILSNIPNAVADPSQGQVFVRCGEHPWLPLHRTFADVPPGGVLAYRGSGGRVEIAIRDDRADQALRISRGSEFRMRFGPPPVRKPRR